MLGIILILRLTIYQKDSYMSKMGMGLFVHSLKNSVQTYINKSDARSVSKDLKAMPSVEYFFWEVNDYCNSKCHSCNIWQRPVNKDYLEVEDIKKIFSSYDFSKVKSVIVSGGEPNLHPNLVECLIEMAKYFEKDCHFAYSTNGLMPERVLSDVRRLIDAGLTIGLGISLDGIGKDHDDARGVKGNFNKVEKLFELVKSYKISLDEEKSNRFNFAVGSTLTPQTGRYLLDVKKYCEEKNITFTAQMYEEFSYYSSYDVINADSILNKDSRFGNSIDVNSKEKDSYKEYDLLKSDEDRRNLLNTIKYLPKNLQFEILKASIEDKPIGFKCGAMTKFFLLHSNGDISPCLKYSHIRTGNAKNGFKDAWDSNLSQNSRVKVADCVGCSNTWATAWSLRHWIFSFMPLIIRSKLRNIIA